MSAVEEYRLRLSQMTLVCSILAAAVLILELSIIPALPYISRTWLHAHPWLWRHYDDRSLLRVYINSWFVSIVLFLISLIGLGKCRRRSFIICALNVVGFPALFFGLLALGGISR